MASRLEKLHQQINDYASNTHPTQQAPQDQQEGIRALEVRNNSIQAFSALAVATFTGALLIFSGLGWWAAKSSADTAGASFERQKLVTELSTRAYVSVAFDGLATHQDADHNFAAVVNILNKGTTPAYGLTAKAAARIIPSKLPEEFDFSIGEATPSVGMLGPGLGFSVRRWSPTRVADDEIRPIAGGGPPQAFLIYGTVNYRDAFGDDRFTNFAMVILWQFWKDGVKGKDGEPPAPRIYCSYLARHNDAN
jgi:hypothetical protein